MFKVQCCFSLTEEAITTQCLFKHCEIPHQVLVSPAQAFYDLNGLQHQLSNHNVDVILQTNSHTHATLQAKSHLK